jgi:hypothetical protein
MPDVINRDELESKLARIVGKEMRSQLTRLMEYLGDPPKLENVPETFWQDGGKQLRGVVQPFFEQVFLDQAEGLMKEVGIGVDWALINSAAIEWARSYTFDLVTGINKTSQELLRKSVADYFESQMTIGDLEQRLTGTFGPVRAEMIAVTEVTRSSVEGELALVSEIEKDNNVKMIAVWNTNNDEQVCPICGPLHGKRQGDGWHVPPPAHPRCRCWLNYEFANG